MSTYSNRLQPALQNLLRVVRFFHPRSSCMTMHISTDVQRITLNASCMTISGERTEQLDIFCHVTGFTSAFLSFIDVELIRFFHGALQLMSHIGGCNLRGWSMMTCEPPSGREFIFNEANWNTEHRRIIIFNTAQCTSKMQPNTMKLNFLVILSQWFHSALPLLAQVCPTMNLVADTLAWQNIYWPTWWLTNQHYNNNNNNNNEKSTQRYANTARWL